MAGYDGYSKSNNALAAESEGKLPLTRAIPEVRSATGCAAKEARAALLANGPVEWHHTSKQYNRTNYYDVGAAVRRINAAPMLAALPQDWLARMKTIYSIGHCEEGRINRINAAVDALAEEYGCKPELLINGYYDCWD